MEPSLVATVAMEPPLAATVATELPLAAMERLPAATLGRLVELETLAAGVPLQTEAMTALRAGGGGRGMVYEDGQCSSRCINEVVH